MSATSPQEVLAMVQAKRGYLLAHHEFFGYPDPAMLEKYDQVYEHLTLKSKSVMDDILPTRRSRNQVDD